MISNDKQTGNFWYNEENKVQYVYSVVIMKQEKVDELIDLKKHYKHQGRRNLFSQVCYLPVLK